MPTVVAVSSPLGHCRGFLIIRDDVKTCLGDKPESGTTASADAGHRVGDHDHTQHLETFVVSFS